MEQPAKARYTADYDGACLHLEIPSRRHWFQLIFMSFWLIFWFIATVTVIGTMIRPLFAAANAMDKTSSFGLLPGAFLFGWLTLWVGGGLFVIYNVLWQIIGYEAIDVDPLSMRITRKVAGLERPRTYDSSYISGLRVAPYVPQSSWTGGYRRQSWMMNTGSIAFDYGAKTVRFGDVDEAEAKMVLDEITRRFPKYKTR